MAQSTGITGGFSAVGLPSSRSKLSQDDPSRSIQVAHRSERSTTTLLLQHAIKPFALHITNIKDELPAGSQPLTVPDKSRKTCNVEERKLADYYVYDITPKTPAEPNPNTASDPILSQPKRIYYFAGGGWQMPASPSHWSLLTMFAEELSPNTHLTLVSYPLAPNSPAPKCFSSLLTFYRTAISTSHAAKERVVLAGDSAGGNVVLAVTLAALAEQPDGECPEALFVMAPSTDLTRSNPAIPEVEKHDPLLKVPFIKETARKWCGEWEARDPRVSPLFADVEVLARRTVVVHGVTGTYDVLGPDAVLFRERLNEVGVRGGWLEWEKQMHCFPLAAGFGLSESVQGKDWIVRVLNRT